MSATWISGALAHDNVAEAVDACAAVASHARAILGAGECASLAPCRTWTFCELLGQPIPPTCRPIAARGGGKATFARTLQSLKRPHLRTSSDNGEGAAEGRRGRTLEATKRDDPLEQGPGLCQSHVDVFKDASPKRQRLRMLSKIGQNLPLIQNGSGHMLASCSKPTSCEPNMGINVQQLR